jgi:hypothetical protein
MEDYRQPVKSVSADSKPIPGLGTFPWNPSTISTLAGFTCLSLVILYVGTVFMAAATVAYGSLVLGLIHRRNRSLHPKLMLLGMAIDLTIVLILEVQRDAIGTALSFSLAALQQAHIGCSSVALLLYFPTLYLGWMLWSAKGGPQHRKLHLRVAITAFVFRTLGFLLMLSFVGANR